MKLILGDSLLKLRDLPTSTVDAVVTDPPYGLAFMGKKWDLDVPSTELWSEVFRVLKPGGHLLSFFGTRTYHGGVTRIEDAGFEIRDMLSWIYGSGFPKSLDVSKAIDKAAGAEREVIGPNRFAHLNGKENLNCYGKASRPNATKSSTDAAKQWQGWGTALKPANEPIVLARKPLEKGLTVAQNVEKWGCGAINVDAGRIGSELRENAPASSLDNSKTMDGGAAQVNRQSTIAQGRWPANLILDEEAAAVLDEQSGVLKSGAGNKNACNKTSQETMFKGIGRGNGDGIGGDSGGASRFFYVAKASKRERNAGLGDDKCTHPTVKPIKLMQYLCRLITPPGGVILDPFMGSGSTGVAAKSLGFEFIGIEREAEYLEIARKRIEHATKQPMQIQLDMEA